MNFYSRRFNLYFCPATLLLVAGCALLDPAGHHVAALRIHLEGDAGSADSNQTVSVIRSHPVQVAIAKNPILTESDVVGARLIESPNGFAVELKFDEIAGWGLEQETAVNPGKHLVIFAQWGKKPDDGRWLAAPSINRRVAAGTLVFTPDASREEAEKFVKGLNLAAEKNLVAISKK